MSNARQQPNRFIRTGIMPGVTIVLCALLITQLSLLFRGFDVRNRLQDAYGKVAEVQGTLAPMVGDLQSKEADIQADRQMVVDLTRTLVKVARAGNLTAQEMLPLVQSDLQQLELRVRLDSLD